MELDKKRELEQVVVEQAEVEKAESKKTEAEPKKAEQVETTAGDNRATGNKGIGKKAGIICAGSAFGLLLLYLIISVFFTSHFVFRTTINGMGVSCRSVKGVQKKADRKVRDYVLTLVARDGSKYEVAGSDIDLVEEWGDIDELLKNRMDLHGRPGYSHRINLNLPEQQNTMRIS